MNVIVKNAKSGFFLLDAKHWVLFHLQMIQAKSCNGFMKLEIENLVLFVFYKTRYVCKTSNLGLQNFHIFSWIQRLQCKLQRENKLPTKERVTLKINKMFFFMYSFGSNLRRSCLPTKKKCHQVSQRNAFCWRRNAKIQFTLGWL